MKKLFLLLFIIILSLSLFNGCSPASPPAPTPSESEGEGEEEPTGDRVVLVELFNTEGCAASKVINPIMEDLAQQYGTDKVILLEEAGWGKYTTSEVQERFDCYVPGSKHTPFIAFNGLSQTFSEGVSSGGGGSVPAPPANRAPTITSTAVTTTTLEVEYTYDVDATDPDGDILTYSLTTKPIDMTINSSSGLITWTPTAKGDFDVVIEVSDGSLTDTQSFTISVVDQPPVVTSTPITTATVGVEYSYDVDATDPDGDDLYYYLIVSPTGMAIDGEGSISWTPTAAHISDNAVVVEVSDLELSVTQSFTITIPGSLSGTVISDASGSAVEGSTVTVDGTTTTTDAQGRFGVASLSDGTYDIIVTQSGRATSKVQDVQIADGQTTIVSLVQKEVNVPEWETDPPTISVTGIAEGDELSGTVSGSVTVTDALDIKYIFIGACYIPTQLEYDFAYYGKSNITLPSLDTTLFPNGDSQITVVAYDMNYNRSQLTLNVTINNENSGDVPAMPTDLWPCSVTLGEGVGFFSTGRNELFDRIGIKENPDIINLPEGRSIDLNAVINVADPDSNLFVEIDWSDVGGATGYKIYRKFEGETVYRLIGSTQISEFCDADPQLSVGRKTYYQVSAFNAFGKSEKTPAEWTTPLPKFNLNLVSPTDGASGVSLTPALQWQPVEVVGKYQHYDWYIIGKNDSYYTGYGTVENETSIVYDDEPLQYLKVYEWNIDNAIAFDDDYGTFIEFRAISIAGEMTSLPNGTGSLNGAFEFTTQSESE
jgi:hypothetical protein